MIPPRELAAQLAGSIFDHVERERNLVRHSIEEVIHDGLLLAQAKQATPATPPLTQNYQQVLDQSAALVRLMMHNPFMSTQTPSPVNAAIDAVYRSLAATGWQP